MYKCECCGETFEEPIIISWVEPYGEPMSSAVCPYCQYEYFDKMFECDFCRKLCFEDDLENGLCINCLKDILDDEVLVAWYFKESNFLDDFVIEKIWPSEDINPAPDKTFFAQFWEFVNTNPNWHKSVVEFVIEDDEFGANAFSKWLQEKWDKMLRERGEH